MSLIFIEIIQLNFCGLSTMTKKNIEIRAALDAIINNDNDDEEEDNKEGNKEGKDKAKADKRISLKEYTIELKSFSINRSSSVLDSDIYSVDSNV